MLRLLLLLFGLMGIAWAQNPAFLPPRKPGLIIVNGYASRVIVPDQITYAITLREYRSAATTPKVSLTALEAQFLEAVTKLGLLDSLSQDQIDIWNPTYWDHKTKKETPAADFLASKTFYLNLSRLDPVAALLDQLDPKGVSRANVYRLTHSRLAQMQEELLVEATRNAQARATAIALASGSSKAVLRRWSLEPFRAPQVESRSRSSDDFSDDFGDDFAGDDFGGAPTARPPAPKIQTRTITIEQTVYTVFDAL